MKGCLQKSLKALVLLMLPFALLAQNGTINGKITDVQGDPLIGVNIIIKETSLGTVSDINGYYELTNLENKEYLLQVSFVGYVTQNYTVDLTVSSNFSLDIVMEEDIKELSEIVIIGYGTQKKSDLTSAVASVSAEDLQQSRAANIQEAMQGRAAGVLVQTNTGAPGANVSVKIRGITSLNGTDPIWIVDGIPTDPKTINSGDIESMEILKDASSAAIYGANGANGVVLVTTKKGRAGKVKVTFDSYWGIQEVTKTIDVTSGPEFAGMYHEYEVLANKRRYFFENPDTLPTYNYQDMIFRTAQMESYNLGISGGSEDFTVYMGIGYLKQEGIIKNSDYKKISIRMNGDYKANEWLKVGINSAFTQQTYIGFEEWQLKDEYATPILAAMNFHSFVEPYAEEKITDSEYDEGWNYTPLGNTNNPLAVVNLLNRESKSNHVNGTFYGIVSPVKGLELESRINGRLTFDQDHNFYPVFFVTNSYKNNVSRINRGSRNDYGWQWQNLVRYSKTLLDEHNIQVLAGYESGYYYEEQTRAERFDLINQNPEMWYFNASTNDTLLSQLPTGKGKESAGYSYLGRFSYDYKGMILGQFNFRRDYSSLFGPRNRSGNFPSFSLGFKFTELNIVRDLVPFMNFGKVRYGWGKIGNNSIDYYQYYSTVAFQTVYGYSYNNTASSSTGAAPDKYVNEAIHWEDVETHNYGIDLAFFDNKLTFSADYFKRQNNGMLMRVAVPYFSGWIVEDPYQEGQVSDPTKNVGELKNTGIEITTGWKERRGKFSYGANVNFTYVKTETGNIKPDTLYYGETKGIGAYLTRTISGQPFGEFYGYITEGLFRLSDMPNADGICTNQPYTVNPDGDIVYAQPKAHPGDFKFKDVNGDGKIDEKDMVSLGNPHPKFLFALNVFAEYGWFDLKMFLQGAAGHKVFNATKFYLFNTDGAFNWSEDYAENHYQVELYDRNDELVTVAKDNAKYPRIDPRGDNGNFTTLSDFYVEDASYIRLKNIELGVTIPGRYTELIGIENFRFYVGAKNLLTLTKYSGLDPEVGASRNSENRTNPLDTGIDKASYPVARMYTAGINVTF